jgi:hypothetical protein
VKISDDIRSAIKKIVKLTRQTHVVDNLRVKFLMSMNILDSEKIVLNISRRRMILILCENLKVIIHITSKLKSRINRIILVEHLVIISAKSVVSISIKMKESLFDRDFLFQSVSRELNLESFDEVMIHLMNANMIAMQVCNFTNKSVMISRKARLDRLIEYEKHECYSIDANESFLAVDSFWKKSGLLVESTWRKVATLINIQTTVNKSTLKLMKKISLNEIIVYDTANIRKRLLSTICKYSSLWDKTENIVIKVSEQEWMSIILKSEAKIEIVKVYSMSSKKRNLIDEIFNKLHDQQKMHWIIEFIAHGALVFVVWRIVNEEKKERVIIDIRDLNKIAEFDSYSMSLQSNIIEVVFDVKFIFVIDVAVFFCQFRMQKADRHKLTVVFHREQEYFFVASMKFKNSSTYAQRRIDIILRNMKHFCRAFIDDIIIFFATLEKHIEHLISIFKRLLEYDIKLNSRKAFLEFSFVALLEQHVERLWITRCEE